MSFWGWCQIKDAGGLVRGCGVDLYRDKWSTGVVGWSTTQSSAGNRKIGSGRGVGGGGQGPIRPDCDELSLCQTETENLFNHSTVSLVQWAIWPGCFLIPLHTSFTLFGCRLFSILSLRRFFQSSVLRSSSGSTTPALSSVSPVLKAVLWRLKGTLCFSVFRGLLFAGTWFFFVLWYHHVPTVIDVSCLREPLIVLLVLHRAGFSHTCTDAG